LIFHITRTGAHIIGGTPFCRETRNCVKSFLKNLGSFVAAMASLVRPDKEVNGTVCRESLVYSPKSQASFRSALDGTKKVSAL
jgi:hypothetical protein